MKQTTSSSAGGSAPADLTIPVPTTDLVPAIELSFKERHKLLLEAQRNGADRETVEGMAERLGAATLTRSQLEEVEFEIAVLVEARDKQVKTYWVSPGQQLMLHGKVCPERTEVQMTPAEAKQNAAVVSAAEPPKPQGPPAERRAGKYRVCEGGSIKYERKFYKPGTVLELDSEAAQSLGVTIESV